MGEHAFSCSVALIDSSGRLLDWDSGLPLEFAVVAGSLVRGGEWREIAARARVQEGFDRTGVATADVGAASACKIRRDYVYRAADRVIHVTEAPLLGGHWSRTARDVTVETPEKLELTELARMPTTRDALATAAGTATPQITILLVDDNDLVRSAVANNLRALNYRILTADGGTAALELLRSREHIDLLFTDVVMPGGISGVELANQARALRPNIKLLFASGLGAIPLQRGGPLAQEVALLMKPYDLPQLLETLRGVLVS